MILNQFMALMLPSIIALKMKKREKDIIKVIVNYIKTLLVVNFLSYVILVYIAKQSDFIFTNEFTVQYMILALIIARIYPVIKRVVIDNIKIQIEVKKIDEEKN